jgi:hypothetical protein
MPILLAAAITAMTISNYAAFNSYPIFDDPTARIEAIIDKGPVAEMVVRCDKGTAIVAASWLEKTYCAPDFTCYASLEKAIIRSCK